MTKQALRHIFWAIIVEGKYGLGEETVFDFKYVPDFHVTTEKGEALEGIRQPGIERRNLKALVYAVGVLGVLSWGACKLTATAFRLVQRY